MTKENIKAIMNRPINNDYTISSTEVAQMIGKEHSKLLKDIRRYKEQIAEANFGLGDESKISLVDFFTETTYMDANNQLRPSYNITRKGCEFIANKLTGTKGTMFTAKFINRFHEMEDTLVNRKYIDQLGEITTSITSFAKSVTELTDSITSMNARIQILEEKNNKPKIAPERTRARWLNEAFSKMKAIQSHINETTGEITPLSKIISGLIIEMEDTYDFEFHDFLNDYMCEYDLKENPYPMTVIDTNQDLKKLFDMTVRSRMEELNIHYSPTKRKTIFDSIINTNLHKDDNEKNIKDKEEDKLSEA